MTAIYRSPYIQKGYGIGGIFRGIARFLQPIARKAVKIANTPAVRNVLKTVGKETLDTGGELLLGSLKGDDDLQSKLKERINTAKKHVMDSIQQGVRAKKNLTRSNKYRRIPDDYMSYDDEEDDELYHGESLPVKRNNSRLPLRNKPGHRPRVRSFKGKSINNRVIKHNKSRANVRNRTVFD